MMDDGGREVSEQNLWVWIDGAIVPAREARVEVLDHGFLYGDSIYETLRSYEGRLFGLREHLERLERSAKAIRLRLPWGRAEITRVLEEVVAARPPEKEAATRLVVTRGVGPMGIDPTPCQNPRLLVLAWPIDPGPHPQAAHGVDIVVTSIHRNPPRALDPHIKSGNFLNNILAFQEARARGAFEGILLTMDGAVAEGTTSNVFWCRNGEVHTSTDTGILLGVTRQMVLAILKREGIPYSLGNFPADDLESAEEAFITSTLKGVLPVASIDGIALPIPAPGPLTRRVIAAYEARNRSVS